MPDIVTPHPAAAEVVPLVERIKRNDAMDQALRQAFAVLGPLLKELPVTDDLLLSPYAVTAWRTLRDHNPDLYLTYRAAVRGKCGRHVTDLLDNHIGPPQPGPVREIKVLTVNDLRAQQAPAWLVVQLLPEVGLVVVYGESQSGKTFLAVHAACSIARGVPCLGHDSNPGAVIYIAAEGRLRDRIEAYLSHHNLTPDDLALLYIIEAAVDLSGNTRDLEQILQRIAEIRERHGVVALVVIDTVARVTPGSDENSGRDMGAFISAARRIEDAAGGVVLGIHHSGKDSSRGARGHSSLRAACDAELEVIRDESGLRTLRVAKLRDSEDGAQFTFRLQAVPLGGDRSSCVVVQSGEKPTQQRRDRKMGADERIALDTLTEEIRASGAILPATSEIPGGKRGVTVEAWRTRFYARLGEARTVEQAARRQAWHRGSKALISRKVVGVWEQWAWLW